MKNLFLVTALLAGAMAFGQDKENDKLEKEYSELMAKAQKGGRFTGEMSKKYLTPFEINKLQELGKKVQEKRAKELVNILDVNWEIARQKKQESTGAEAILGKESIESLKQRMDAAKEALSKLKTESTK